MTKEEVVALMRSSKSEEEWNENCDLIKLQCDGYPSFWFNTIIMSGLYQQVSMGW